MVLLNNTHYSNVVLPVRVTDHIQLFFNTLGLVAEAEQVVEEEEEEAMKEEMIRTLTQPLLSI